MRSPLASIADLRFRSGPKGPGLNDFQRGRADALAELGYVALAVDVHGGRWFTDPEEMLARVTPRLADPDRTRGIGHAALDVVRAEPRTAPGRIAAIGYSGGSGHDVVSWRTGPGPAGTPSRAREVPR